MRSAWSRARSSLAPMLRRDSSQSQSRPFPDFPPTISTPTVIVHTEYDDPPPRPEHPERWTRFVCISDTHSHLFPVPDGDVLLHSGDLTNTGTLRDFEITVQFLKALPHKHKIIIAGNHDLSLDQASGWYEKNWTRWHQNQGEQDYAAIMDLLKGPDAAAAGIVYLEDERYELQVKEGGRQWSVWGSPWQPWFGGWAFNYERGAEAESIVGKIPPTDILLTHGPPHLILDRTIDGSNAGCEALAARLCSGSLRPRLHVFGHIHEAHGVKIDDAGTGAQGPPTVFVNAANWPMGPRVRNRGQGSFAAAPFQPVIVDLLDET